MSDDIDFAEGLVPPSRGAPQQIAKMIQDWHAPKISDLVDSRCRDDAGRGEGSWLVDFLEAQGVDPLWITATIISALQTGVARGWFQLEAIGYNDDESEFVTLAKADDAGAYEGDTAWFHGKSEDEEGGGGMIVLRDLLHKAKWGSP